MCNCAVVLLVVAVCHFQGTWGHSRFMSKIPGGRQVPHPCPGGGNWGPVGHIDTSVFNGWNAFGNDFRTAGLRWTPELCRQDSDGDGYSNGEELGDPNCSWDEFRRTDSRPQGHPGFCEPDRPSCRMGSSYRQCSNPNDAAARRVPVRAPSGKHPQSLETERLGMQGRGRMGVFQQQPRIQQQQTRQQQTFIPQEQQIFRQQQRRGFQMQGPGPQWANDVPSLGTFQANLNQMRLQGGGGAPGIPQQEFGVRAPGMSMGNIQSQVQRRMQMERLTPGTSSNMWPVGGATGGAPQLPFGSMEMRRGPMSPTAFMMDRSSPMIGPMGYPQF